MQRKWVVLECSFLFVVLIAAAISFFTPFVHGCSDLYASMLRMHVIANSDTERDQQLKLLVRDTLLREGAALFDGAADVQSARAILEPHFPELEAAAQNALKENGCGDTVHITIEETFFETRTYGEYTVPAGTYTAMCVRIGEAKGKNWWCVMYPPLCLPAAAKNTDAAFTADGKAVLSSDAKYDVRFQVVEWVQKAKAKHK